MFKLTLSPQYSDQILKLEKRGSILTIGDKSCDFAPLADGSDVPPEAIDNAYIVGGITKRNDIVNITVLMPYSDVDAPDSVLFPKPIMMAEDGEIVFNEKVVADD